MSQFVHMIDEWSENVYNLCNRLKEYISLSFCKTKVNALQSEICIQKLKCDIFKTSWLFAALCTSMNTVICVSMSNFNVHFLKWTAWGWKLNIRVNNKVVLYYIISCRALSSLSYGIVSNHVVSYYFVSVLSCCIVSYRVLHYRVVLCHVLLYHSVSCHIVLCCIMLYRVLSCPILS